MWKPIAAAALTGFVMLGAFTRSNASGPLGIFGIIERVHFYPDEAHAERIQMWGAFSYQACAQYRFEGPLEKALLLPRRGSMTEPQYGYMYFAQPVKAASYQLEQLKREWLYIKSVAGTDQAIGFGSGLCGLVGRRSGPGQPMIYESHGQPGIRVRPASESPMAPAQYPINIGALPLSNDGTQADLVKQLRNALRK
jgi:hypothetical protein